jgi:hypothetical protein
MKPLLWRIVGCVLCALPGVVIWWLWVPLFKDVIMPILDILGFIAFVAVSTLIVIGMIALGRLCFDKAKRPPR